MLIFIVQQLARVGTLIVSFLVVVAARVVVTDLVYHAAGWRFEPTLRPVLDWEELIYNSSCYKTDRTDCMVSRVLVCKDTSLVVFGRCHAMMWGFEAYCRHVRRTVL